MFWKDPACYTHGIQPNGNFPHRDSSPNGLPPQETFDPKLYLEDSVDLDSFWFNVDHGVPTKDFNPTGIFPEGISPPMAFLPNGTFPH